MKVYCDRGIYKDGIFHVRGGTVNEYFSNDGVDIVDSVSKDIYLPPGTYEFGF